MKAPYKLMDKKMEQRQARAKEHDKFRYLSSIPITSEALNKQRSSLQRSKESHDKLSQYDAN